VHVCARMCVYICVGLCTCVYVRVQKRVVKGGRGLPPLCTWKWAFAGCQPHAAEMAHRSWLAHTRTHTHGHAHAAAHQAWHARGCLIARAGQVLWSSRGAAHAPHAPVCGSSSCASERPRHCSRHMHRSGQVLHEAS